MGKRGGQITLITIAVVLVLGFSAAAAKVTCADDGSFTIEKASKTFPVYAQTKTGEQTEVTGEWVEIGDSKIKALRKFNFYADEGTFITAGPTKQKIKVGKTTYTVSCPAFRFSCRLFNLSIDYCYTINGTFHAKYAVHNFNIDEKKTLRFDKPFVFRYDLVLPGQKRLTHAPTILSPEFAELNITLRKLAALNKFIMEAPLGPEEVQALEIRYEQCSQRKFNLFEWKPCSKQPACTINKDCQDDEQCPAGFCQKLVCGDCEYAVNNSCARYECCDNEACPAEASCQDNRCVALSCTGEQTYQEHACVDLLCADDEYAQDHSCVKLSCAEDEAPQNHTCMRLECAEDEFIQNQQCQPLNCAFFTAAVNHECQSWLALVKEKLMGKEKLK